MFLFYTPRVQDFSVMFAFKGSETYKPLFKENFVIYVAM